MHDTSADTGTEYNDLTERQREIVALAARHADDFATRAAEHDREASFAYENFAAMHESGYAHWWVAGECGGRDGTLEELCLAQERLARGCASTALGANMHLFSTGMQSERLRDGEERFAMGLQGIVQGKMTVGGSLSESESADPFTAPASRVERVEGGYKLNGRKVFGSNSLINPMMFFNGLLEENGERKVMFFLVPKGTPGATLMDDWDTMGMRGTGSVSMEMKDCIVPEAFLLMENPVDAGRFASPFIAAFVCWFDTSIAGVYTGIGAAARDYAKATVADKSRLPYGALKHTPAVQYALAEMYIGIEASRGFVRRAAQRLSDPAWRTPDALAQAAAVKLFATENAVRVVDQAMDLMGGGAFFRRLPLERLYRDVRAGKFHPPNRWDGMELIGKAELGIASNIQPRFL